MILYVNGDSHTAAAEAVNSYAFAEDDSKYWHMERRPHPDNLAVSWGRLLADRLKANFYCDAESASSNDRIIRTTKEWISLHQRHLYRTIIVIQWSTWEREEWLIDDKYYQVNASGIDVVPASHQQQYKEYIADIHWQQKQENAHNKIYMFHKELLEKNIKHVFFNGNNSFDQIKDKFDWGVNYIGPYDKNSTFHNQLSKNFETVSTTSWHYDAGAHRHWANHILHYLLDNQLV